MITLENFINLCNLEGLYSFVSIEQKEHSFELLLFNTPILGNNFARIEEYYNNIVTNVSFNLEDKSILIEVR